MTSPRRVLGIDPGTRVTGWGVVERTAAGERLVACGTIRPREGESAAQRLATIHRGVLGLVSEHVPEACAVEDAFAGRNVRSAIKLAQARAVCLLAAELSSVPVHEVAPALVKKAVSGHGRAGKESVRSSVLGALGYEGAPPAYDASDALAIGLTVLRRLDAPDALVAGVGRRRRRGRRWSAEDLKRHTQGLETIEHEHEQEQEL